MPLNEKGRKIMKSMKKQYGKKRGETVFYASKNKGVIKGVEKKKTRSKNAMSAIEEVGIPSALNLLFLAIWLGYVLIIICRLVLVNDQ